MGTEKKMDVPPSRRSSRRVVRPSLQDRQRRNSRRLSQLMPQPTTDYPQNLDANPAQNADEIQPPSPCFVKCPSNTPSPTSSQRASRHFLSEGPARGVPRQVVLDTNAYVPTRPISLASFLGSDVAKPPKKPTLKEKAARKLLLAKAYLKNPRVDPQFAHLPKGINNRIVNKGPPRFRFFSRKRKKLPPFKRPLTPVPAPNLQASKNQKPVPARVVPQVTRPKPVTSAPLVDEYLNAAGKEFDFFHPSVEDRDRKIRATEELNQWRSLSDKQLSSLGRTHISSDAIGRAPPLSKRVLQEALGKAKQSVKDDQPKDRHIPSAQAVSGVKLPVKGDRASLWDTVYLKTKEKPNFSDSVVEQEQAANPYTVNSESYFSTHHPLAPPLSTPASLSPASRVPFPSSGRSVHELAALFVGDSVPLPPRYPGRPVHAARVVLKAGQSNSRSASARPRLNNHFARTNPDSAEVKAHSKGISELVTKRLVTETSLSKADSSPDKPVPDLGSSLKEDEASRKGELEREFPENKRKLKWQKGYTTLGGNRPSNPEQSSFERPSSSDYDNTCSSDLSPKRQSTHGTHSSEYFASLYSIGNPFQEDFVEPDCGIDYRAAPINHQTPTAITNKNSNCVFKKTLLNFNNQSGSIFDNPPFFRKKSWESSEANLSAPEAEVDHKKIDNLLRGADITTWKSVLASIASPSKQTLSSESDHESINSFKTREKILDKEAKGLLEELPIEPEGINNVSNCLASGGEFSAQNISPNDVRRVVHSSKIEYNLIPDRYSNSELSKTFQGRVTGRLNGPIAGTRYIRNNHCRRSFAQSQIVKSASEIPHGFGKSIFQPEEVETRSALIRPVKNWQVNKGFPPRQQSIPGAEFFPQESYTPYSLSRDQERFPKFCSSQAIPRSVPIPPVRGLKPQRTPRPSESHLPLLPPRRFNPDPLRSYSADDQVAKLGPWYPELDSVYRARGVSENDRYAPALSFATSRDLRRPTTSQGTIRIPLENRRRPTDFSKLYPRSPLNLPPITFEPRARQPFGIPEPVPKYRPDISLRGPAYHSQRRSSIPPAPVPPNSVPPTPVARTEDRVEKPVGVCIPIKQHSPVKTLPQPPAVDQTSGPENQAPINQDSPHWSILSGGIRVHDRVLDNRFNSVEFGRTPSINERSSFQGIPRLSHTSETVDSVDLQSASDGAEQARPSRSAQAIPRTNGLLKKQITVANLLTIAKASYDLSLQTSKAKVIQREALKIVRERRIQAGQHLLDKRLESVEARVGTKPKISSLIRILCQASARTSTPTARGPLESPPPLIPAKSLLRPLPTQNRLVSHSGSRFSIFPSLKYPRRLIETDIHYFSRINPLRTLPFVVGSANIQPVLSDLLQNRSVSSQGLSLAQRTSISASSYRGYEKTVTSIASAANSLKTFVSNPASTDVLHNFFPVGEIPCEFATMEKLQVRSAELSVIKTKAVEDARQMQATVMELAKKSGQDPPKFALLELIGKGSFGRVYKGKDMISAAIVAVKIIDIDESDTANPRNANSYSEFLKEINALKILSENKARNINHVIEALPVGQSMWMITEYCGGGSIATLMKPTAPGGLLEKWIIPILREVAEGLKWVHQAGIIHRDIKCANVLITEEGLVQLCDFGVAGIVESKIDKRTTVIGTPHWMAPELFDATVSYGKEIDIWAYGSMIYEMATGFPPNAVNRIPFERLGNHLKHHVPRLEGDNYSAELRNLVAYCLEELPSARPTIEEVQKHPYIYNTQKIYPTLSLSNLVRAFKAWEDHGGSRQSLFMMGGAQGPSENSPSNIYDDEWNFSTTSAFDQQASRVSTQDVYEAYGTSVLGFSEEPSRPTQQKPSRRRPPPEALARLPQPLEKIFDPNTLSSYEDNSRSHYGREMPPQTSDLPLRDDTEHTFIKDTMIDLGGHDTETGLSSFTDMDTIKAVRRGTRDENEDEWDSTLDEFHRPPLSDPADINPNRRTQDWKFPTMAPPASADPEISRFPQSHELPRPAVTPGSGGRPALVHHPTEPLGGFGGMLASTQGAVDRISMRESLIDLDMSLPDPVPELTRPSTANSDAGSTTSEQMVSGNAFELERHASLYRPPERAQREPSIYVTENPSSQSRPTSTYQDVSDMSDFSSSDVDVAPRDGSQTRELPAPYNSNPADNSDHLYTSSSDRSGWSRTAGDRTYTLADLPDLPQPPSTPALMGTASRSQMKSEFMTQLSGMTSQLEFFREAFRQFEPAQNQQRRNQASQKSQASQGPRHERRNGSGGSGTNLQP